MSGAAQKLTDLQVAALRAMAATPWLSGADLTVALGVKNRHGQPMTNQGAGGWGVRYAKRLVKMGLACDRLIDRGWRSGFALTAAGRTELARRADGENGDKPDL